MGDRELRIQDNPIVPTAACLTLVRDEAWTETALGLEEQRRRLQEDLAKNEALQIQQARDEKLRRKTELEAWQRKETQKKLEKDRLAKEESKKARESAARMPANASKASPATPATKKTSKFLESYARRSKKH